jgi:hypothetical protein
MPLFFLVVAAVLSSPTTSAQNVPSSPPTSTAQDAPSLDLPVSLDRIRQLLARAPVEPLIGGPGRQPDFKITIEERRYLETVLESLRVKPEPAPAGGLYGYETQQQVNNMRNSPLTRPYAAFSSSELLQVSLTSILSALVMKYMTDSVKAMSRAQAEAAAREEVQHAIADYCSARPDRAFIDICKVPDLR